MEVINKPGTYLNFTGRVEYKLHNSNATIGFVVKDADVELYDETRYYKGTMMLGNISGGSIVDGTLWYFYIENCVFSGNTLNYCVFQNSTFKRGIFNISRWLDSKWVNGNWNSGYDKFGREYTTPPTEWDRLAWKKSGIANEPGVYREFSGTIEWEKTNCVVKKSCFEICNGHYYTLNFHDVTVVKGNVNSAFMNTCVFNGSELTNCHFNDGTFNGVLFKGGTFEGGTWNGKFWDGYIWMGGYDIKGNWHDKGDSPDKWSD